LSINKWAILACVRLIQSTSLLRLSAKPEHRLLWLDLTLKPGLQPISKNFRWHRLGKQETLNFIALACAQLREFRLGFDAFGNHL